MKNSLRKKEWWCACEISRTRFMNMSHSSLVQAWNLDTSVLTACHSGSGSMAGKFRVTQMQFSPSANWWKKLVQTCSNPTGQSCLKPDQLDFVLSQVHFSCLYMPCLSPFLSTRREMGWPQAPTPRDWDLAVRQSLFAGVSWQKVYCWSRPILSSDAETINVHLYTNNFGGIISKHL